MADSTYGPKVYRDSSGDRQKVVSGGILSLESGGSLQVDPVAGGATLTVTRALHDGHRILLDTAAGTIVTLPAASGTGACFRFMISLRSIITCCSSTT